MERPERRKYRTDEEVRKALKLSGQNVHYAAEILGISRQALYERLRRKPRLAKFRVAKVRLRPRPRFSDKECEELVLHLGGDLERFRRWRNFLAEPGPNAIATRFRELQEAFARTFDFLPASDVLPSLKKAWKYMQIAKQDRAEHMRWLKKQELRRYRTGNQKT